LFANFEELLGHHGFEFGKEGLQEVFELKLRDRAQRVGL
jgi:hypothetical protein